MTSSELHEHASYFRDQVKLDAYQRAIAAVVKPDDVVVDLGAGTGLLGLMAARAGAGRVYLIEKGAILGAAVEVFRANGYDDVCVPVRGHSTDVSLPEPADVVVCDQAGGFVYDAGVLEYFADAERRFLKPGGALVPSGFTLHIAPARAPELRSTIDLWSSSPAGIDTSALHWAAVNTEWRADSAVALVSPGQRLASLASSSLDPVRGRPTFEIEDDGRIDGIVGWFTADLCPDVVLTNDPGDEQRMARWCNFYPLPQPIDARAGDTLDVQVDVHPALPAVTWRIVWSRQGRELGGWRQSTLQALFLGPGDLRGSSGALAPATALPAARSALIEALSAAGSGRSAREIVGEVLTRHPEAFPNARRGRDVLMAELMRWGGNR